MALALALTGCSADDGQKSSRADQPSGPIAELTPLTGGDGIRLASATAPPALPEGWVEEELRLSGNATSYRDRAGLPADGRYDLVAYRQADYDTRVVVRRPPEDAFNGTVVVEWLNVSGGFDAHPDYSYTVEELTRGGYAWVGVSAQHIGIEGGPVAIQVASAEETGAGTGLRAADPERYGELRHPGDAFAYDIFTQVGRTIRDDDLLGGLEAERVLAVGESQSGFALTTYANGVQPLTDMFDGFLIHSRGGSPAPLGTPAAGIDIVASIGGEPTTIRADLDVPVLTLQTETDVVGIFNYLAARQDDTDTFRLWEVAGTAHADEHLVGPIAERLGCPRPINDGPHHLVAKAALRALDRWVRDGVAPPTADRLEVESGDSPAYVRDRDGIATGGIRTPLVDVPVDVLSGESAGGPLACFLFGSTEPLPVDRLAQRHPSRAAYLEAFEGSADEAIAAGFVLAEDRDALLATAQPGRLAR
ncbi:alpha/beta hydrolase domain-containing protein [Nocardioides pacificus]